MSLVEHYHAAIDKMVAIAPHGDDKFVHVQAGLLVWCLAAQITRRPLSSAIPLAAILAAELINELMDRLYSGSWAWPDTSGDMLATWLWPAALFLLLRREDRLRRAGLLRKSADGSGVTPDQANSGTGPRPPVLQVDQFGNT